VTILRFGLASKVDFHLSELLYSHKELLSRPAPSAASIFQILYIAPRTNETIDSTYSGTTATGQVTFYGDHMTVDSGGFAAAGIVAGSEESGCGIPADPISVKFIGDSVLYVSYLAQQRGDGFSFAEDAVITIVKHGGNELTMVGNGGCGVQGISRVSYLKRAR
jgi:hypothetical protein